MASNAVVMSVFDRAQESFGRPFFVRREAEGVRMFTSEVNRQAPDNLLFQHPDSFELWSLGEFDDDQGTFSGSPRFIISGLQSVIASKGGNDVSQQVG